MNAWTAPRPSAEQTSRWTRNGEFLVYLVPVGAISAERYAAYVALLQQHRALPISALTRPGGYAPELSPFKSFSWQSTGAIRFRFVSTAERVESCDGEDVHAWNRPIGVIGICHCPSTPNLKDAYTQFAASIKHFPGTLVQKCFAFEHQFEVGTVEQVASLSNLVMFPVHHELDAGVSTVSLHLQVVMDTIAVTILMSLESTIRAAMRQQAQSHHSLPFQTSFEFGDMTSFLLDTNVEPSQSQMSQSSMPLLSSREGAGGTSQPQSLHAAITSMASTAVSTTASAFTSPFTDSRSRKRQIARHRKLFGDYSVLLDCVPDALEHYAAALELLKDEERKSNGAGGDVLWLAAALEGYIYCLFLESKDQFIVEIVEKASEAIALYAKAGASDLECQLIEKIGWYCVAVASQLAQAKTKGTEKVNEAIWVKRLLWDTLDRGLMVFPELQMQRQIEFIIEASRMLESVGHRRRMAFFMHEAVTLLIGRNNTRPVSSVTSPSLQGSTMQRQRDLQAALLLERITAARLGITEDSSNKASVRGGGGDSRDWEVTTLYRSKKARRGVQIDPAPLASHEEVWLILRFHVLRQLLTISKMLGDPFLVGKYCIQLLQMLPWCDSIASHTTISPKRATNKASNSRRPAAGRGANTPSVDQAQRPFTMQRNVVQSAERQGLFARTSVYYTPPSSVETKAKRYFTLAGSPSATMSSAAASLSSTIASTPRILATPRQQFSAAVNAISTKASPAFASFSHHSHSHISPHGAHSNNNSVTGSPSLSGSTTSSEIGLSPGTYSNRENGFESPPSSGVNSSSNSNSNSTNNRGLNSRTTIQDRMLEPLLVWNIRSKEEVVKMEKNILSLMESECSSLRPSEQVKLSTFLGIDRIRVLAKLDHPFFTKAKALEQYALVGGTAGGAALQDSTTKSDFFYSPFEKQQEEKRRAAGIDDSSSSSSSSAQDNVFPVYEKIELEMVVSNPFGVAIDIQQATAWVDYDEESDGVVEGSLTTSSTFTNAAIECYPCSFVLAPYEKQKSVLLGVQPLKQGKFHVRGCFLKVLNLKTSFALSTPVELRVVGKLPLASLSLCEFGSLSSHSVDQQAKASKEQKEDLRICMFSSETKQCELRIRNVGQNTINKCRLKATVLRKQVVKKTMVVFHNLTFPPSGSASQTPENSYEQMIETDSITLRCRLLSSGGAVGGSSEDIVSVPMANGDVVSIQFEILLLQKNGSHQHKYSNEDEPLEEEEEIVWSFVYADDPAGDDEDRLLEKGNGRESPVVYYRETKLALKLVSLPSLKLFSVSLLPSTSESIPVGSSGGPISRRGPFGEEEEEEESAILSSAVMDNLHFLLVVEVENPTETAFRFRMRRRISQNADRMLTGDGEDEDEACDFSCDVEIGRKCSRRLAIEVPRAQHHVATTSSAHNELANLLNALVEMEWETYFGTKGKLLFEEFLWRRGGQDNKVAKRELFLPEFAFEISVPGSLPSSKQLLAVQNDGEGDANGESGIPMLDGDGLKKENDEEMASLSRSPFIFFQGTQLSGERRQLAVRVLEFVQITFEIRNLLSSFVENANADGGADQQNVSVCQASIEIRITQESEEEGFGDDGDSSSLVDENVVVVGMLRKDLEWSIGNKNLQEEEEKTQVKTHEIQVLFLSHGEFRVSICGRILGEESSQVREIWSHQPLYILSTE